MKELRDYYNDNTINSCDNNVEYVNEDAKQLYDDANSMFRGKKNGAKQFISTAILKSILSKNVSLPNKEKMILSILDNADIGAIHKDLVNAKKFATYDFMVKSYSRDGGGLTKFYDEIKRIAKTKRYRTYIFDNFKGDVEITKEIMKGDLDKIKSMVSLISYTSPSIVIIPTTSKNSDRLSKVAPSKTMGGVEFFPIEGLDSNTIDIRGLEYGNICVMAKYEDMNPEKNKILQLKVLNLIK